MSHSECIVINFHMYKQHDIMVPEIYNAKKHGINGEQHDSLL